MNEEENKATFLGHEIPYWLELEKKARKLKEVSLIEEISFLRGKVNFYESRLRQMNELLTKGDKWSFED